MRLAICLFAIVVLACSTAVAQAPVIGEGGVVDAASYRPANLTGTVVAPGSIVSIFGTTLAASVASAPTIPLPTMLNGTSVTIGGKAAPLFFVAPGQINAQVPWSVAAGNQAVVVTTAAGASNTVNVAVGTADPALFSQTASGRGAAVAQNFESANILPLNNFSKAAKPGQYLILYGTGLGPVQNPPADGAAGGGQATTNAVTVLVGGKSVAAAFAGLAPGFVGLYQVNVQLPSDLAEGCFIPVQLSVGGKVSNAVTIAVANSGDCSIVTTGAFAPGNGTRFGVAVLTRFESQFDSSIPLPTTISGSFTGMFARASTAGSSASGSSFPPIGGGCVAEVYKADQPPSTDYLASIQFLDAGTLTLTGPNAVNLQLTRNQTAGIYQQSPLTVATGNWSLSASGGVDVGAFGPVNLNIPALFQVSSFGFSSSNFSQSQALTPTWVCPDSNTESQVSLTISSFDGINKLWGVAYCTARCTAGTTTVATSVLQQLPPSGPNSAAVTLMFIPDYAKVPKITATGLDIGYFTYLQGVSKIGVTLVP